MFFAATALTEFWDKDDELLFPGPWCNPYDKRAEWGKLRTRMLPNPWEDLDRFRKADAYTDELTESLLAALGPYLNGVLKTSHGERYWRVILSRWLTYHVQLMYDHYVHVQDAFAAHPGLKTILLDPASFQTPRDFGDFVRLALSDRYQLQVFSEFLALRGSFPKRSGGGEARPVPVEVAGKPGGLKTRVKRVLERLWASAPAGIGDVAITELALTGKENVALILRSGLKVRPFTAVLPPSLRFAPVADARREGLAGVFTPRDEFERALVSTLPRYLPTLYLEGHEAARAFALERLGNTPKIFFSSTGWHANEPFKFAAAEGAERGAKLWGMPHGGVYGNWEHAESERFERRITDRYHAWGWADTAGDPKVVDLPHPMLQRFRGGDPNGGLLFVAVAIIAHNIRLARFAGERMGLDCVDRQERFMRALPPDVFAATTARFFYSDYGWHQQERLRDRLPGLRFDDRTKAFHERLRGARLAVYDCPMTTFLESFGSDVPSILTWSPDDYTFRPAAQPYFDRLKEAGILFDDPAEAARQAARVYADPRAWWDSPKVKEARTAFTDHYALNHPDWLGAWTAEIREALRA